MSHRRHDFVTNIRKGKDEVSAYMQIARIVGVPIEILDDAMDNRGRRYEGGLACYVIGRGRSDDLISIMRSRFWEGLQKYPSCASYDDLSSMPKLSRSTNIAIPDSEKFTPNIQSP